VVVSATTSVVCFTVLDLVLGTRRKWRKYNDDGEICVIPWFREKIGIDDRDWVDRVVPRICTDDQ